MKQYLILILIRHVDIVSDGANSGIHVNGGKKKEKKGREQNYPQKKKKKMSTTAATHR